MNKQRAILMFTAGVLLLSPASVFGADPLDDLKKNLMNGLGAGGAAFSALQACQSLAPAPFGSFVPASETVTVPGITVNGPFPITIPATTLTIPAFLPPLPRVCPIAATGSAQGDPANPSGKSTFDAKLNVDFSTYRSNGSGGGCSQASGTLTLVKSDNGANDDSLTLSEAGLVCDVAGIGSAKIFTGAYYVTGGTRKYAGAAGNGNITFSFDPSRVLMHIDGNILFADKR